jgi:transposase-like protein
MNESTRKGDVRAALDPATIADPLHEQLRAWVRTAVESLLEAEVTAALQAARYVRGAEARTGYRHAGRARQLTTSLGPTLITVPRARLFDATGAATMEWQPTLLTRYQRRTRAIDQSLLGAYLAGANTRRIRGALAPLLRDAPLSKSAVSRVLRTLREGFEHWRQRSLVEERVIYLLLDAIAVKVRIDRRVACVPVLVAMGVRETGEKTLLAVQLMGSESKAAWTTFVEDLAARGVAEPALVILDGNAGLRHAVGQTWPGAAVQRCVVHKLRNLEAHAPKRLVPEIRADFRAITEAETLAAARRAYDRFRRVWRGRAEGVVRSLEEAGPELLTFYAFPRSQRRSLRTTNAIERLHEEFRRRVKTQAAHPHEQTVLRLFFGLYASGQIILRKIDGWIDLPQVIARRASVAA